MTATTREAAKTLIHVGFRRGSHAEEILLLLRQLSPAEFRWFEDRSGVETATDVSAKTKEEAIENARKVFKLASFRTLKCGFRYTLPERDEHGMNALFFQMKASLLSPNGIYFDEEMGHNCFVQNMSLEAKKLLTQLNKENRL
ncbi:hypothetical protein [Estrella lausannensis]|uniref:Uncharacterized protein n=1 Tax=Estrella lausannensis TaxID=483423 RepID=A0A0H5DNZ0_9BACT|nr:hypothetical protein [Estrella lausannensis]CRX38057.1 Conserved hypothetical protein [Estrella lausannensis]